MKTTLKKTVSVLLSLLMLLSVFGGMAFTAGAETQTVTLYMSDYDRTYLYGAITPLTDQGVTVSSTEDAYLYAGGGMIFLTTAVSFSAWKAAALSLRSKSSVTPRPRETAGTTSAFGEVWRRKINKKISIYQEAKPCVKSLTSFFPSLPS